MSKTRPELMAMRRSERRKAIQRRHRIVAGLAALVIIIVAFGLFAVVRFESETTPMLRATSTLETHVVFPGAAPALTWPAEGQAAVTVAGLGSLGGSGSSTPRPIASVAKVMTAYLILHDFPMAVGANGFSITVTDADVDDTDAREDQAQSVVPVFSGEVLTEYQLLEGLLIPSANNFAVLLAEHDSTTVSAFVAKMNATARSLGMASTTYTDPSGFDPATTSTAPDQTILAQVAMQQPVFAAVVAMKSATLPEAGQVTNFDHILGTDGFVGIKTGSDSTAGGSFVFADRRTIDGHQVTIFGAVLGQDVGVHSTSALVAAAQAAAEKMADSAAAALSVKTVLPSGTMALTVTNAEHKVVTAATTSPVARLGWGGMVIPLHLSSSPPGTRLTAGQVVGSVTCGPAGPGRVGSGVTDVVAAATMPALTQRWKIDHIF